MPRKKTGNYESSISFQKKLLLSYFLIILIPSLSALFIFGVNSYKQTINYYEDFMNQLSSRADTMTDEFISNTARNSFFYLTDNKLKAILEKRYKQDKIELLDDASYMQTAMDQIVLMNGHIASLSILGLNGTTYSSSSPYPGDLTRFITTDSIGDIYHMYGTFDKKDGRVTVLAPDSESERRHRNKTMSLVRYLSDLNMNNQYKDGYVKVDVNFRAVEKIFGGISKAYTDLGTIVVADDKMIYHSLGLSFNDADIKHILTPLRQEKGAMHKLTHIQVKDVSYLFTARVNKSTNWLIIQLVPSKLITSTFQANIRIYVMLCLLSLIIACLLAVLFSNHFFKPIHRLRTKMKLVDAGKLDMVIDEENRRDEIGQLVQSYNAMLLRLKLSREMEIRSQHLQKKAELNMLQAQINPHFLYNTLNVIHSIAQLHRLEKVSVVASCLANLYRYNIKSKDIVTIEKEVDQIKNYIAIQQIRFLNKHGVIYEIDEELYQYNVLKFLLQPLVENSYHHGLEPKGGHGTLIVSIEKIGHTLRIRVKDDGVGMNDQALKDLQASLEEEIYSEHDDRSNFGLRNVCARIKNFYGDHYSLNITSILNQGTCVEMVIPAKREMEMNAYSHSR